MIRDHLLENVPNLFVLPLQHLLGRLDRVGVTELFEATDDERLVEFQGDLLGETALVQFQSRADHDHTSCRIVDSLAKQVLAEAALVYL